MNTITQIEIALKAINEAGFQSLINHLLYLQGNKFIGAPGAVAGKEKTSRGVPDSFFVNDGKYTFVECTTQERVGKAKSFFEKLSQDIDHCFKEEATTINREKIERVVLACTEKISPQEYRTLDSKVKSYNLDTKFEILNIQNLPLLIFDIPKLAEEYLNVQIIKGDIFTLEEFLLKTTKGLQPSLTNEFVGREEELKECIEALRLSDILLLSGGAGVGKSKLAVKILEELSKEGYIPLVIQSSGVSLWDDYKHLFSPGKQYIILFDDANKSVTNLNYLLSKLETARAYSAKIIITSRDYVKKQVSIALDNYLHSEVAISEFKDEEVGKIVVSALPNLKYHHDIKRKIVELAKGNARVALMATYSVTPDAEINYLNSPVLLYERYFKKISEEIGILDKPIILKSLAIVSFFGFLDRSNDKLSVILKEYFDISWNDLWSAIMELHNHEILDVYSNEVVKVSDQVLATYAFYKCFIDERTAAINYAKWIILFMEKSPKRVSSTLIDVNNTFSYHYIKNLVLPHLNWVLKNEISDTKLYSFYELFWFYKDRECLLYLKKWIECLSQEQHPESFEFSYVHNNHTTASKYFELLKEFWNHASELLRPSIEMTLDLLVKEPSRLPEVLKFLHDAFTYKLDDRDNNYVRQSTLLDILIDDALSEQKKTLANGIFLMLAEMLLGWHYTEFSSGKGTSITICNFDLYKSEMLMHLRGRILNQVYNLFAPANRQVQRILQQIINPGGDIDKTIYVEELPIYQRIVTDKLDRTQYFHCRFVETLINYFVTQEALYPENWNEFAESDIMKLSKFIKPGWEYRGDKSIEEFETIKRKEFDEFVRANEKEVIEDFLLKVGLLYRQQIDNLGWYIESAVTDIYISIAKKDKRDFESALRLFFSGQVLFPLRTTVINFAVLNNIVAGEDFLNVINEYEFEGKIHWLSVLLMVLPNEQVNEIFLQLLIRIFSQSGDSVYIHKMLDYLKYDEIFKGYKVGNPELESHNIITYLTAIILSKTQRSRRDFGFYFCVECAAYFSNHINLLKQAYWAQLEADQYFDLDGEEMNAILVMEKTFINDSVKSGIIGLGYSAHLRLEKVNTSKLWEFDEYEELIEDLIMTVLVKADRIYLVEDDFYSLFRFRNVDQNRTKKVMSFITRLTNKYAHNHKLMSLLLMTVYHNYEQWFISYLRDFLLLNKDVEIIRNVSFGRTESWSGSRVPLIQKKIDFYRDILKMINAMPNILDYSEHIDYFEQKVARKKREIEDEQRRDFTEEFY